MPSQNKTPNYNLNQWEGTEYPLRTDFNDDNAKIDAALGKINQNLDEVDASKLGGLLPSVFARQDQQNVFDNHQVIKKDNGYLQFRDVADGLVGFVQGLNTSGDMIVGTYKQGGKFKFNDGTTSMEVFHEGNVPNVAQFKNGSGTFPDGTTHTVYDPFITEDTLVTISPTANKENYWDVVSYNGYFVITSKDGGTGEPPVVEPSSVSFNWSATKGGV